MNDLLVKINFLIPGLPRAEKAFAQALVENTEAIAGMTLAEAAQIMKRYPQVMINVKVSHEGKMRFYLDSDVKAAIEWGKTTLGKDGRVVARVSGTESLIRVMTEGIDYEKIEHVANHIADTVRERLA